MQLKIKSGFTLVELLVVIVIIAALAAISFAVGPKILRRADASKSIQNIRQIGPVMMTYAADNAFRLPAIRGMVTDDTGTEVDQIWHETLLAQLYPETPMNSFRREAWWEANQPFLRNPMLRKNSSPRKWTPTNPGYAINRRIWDNLDREPQERIPLSILTDQSRTPIVAPYDDNEFTFVGGQLTSRSLQNLMIDGQFPVLFVDGHVEVMTPRQYEDRELQNIPNPRR
jgi:prepilin-type N-terminal cleavage/methylation domain-containing protein/prepilin-type processing-associated H-X9-DG protein